VAVQPLVYDGAHEWTAAIVGTVDHFLARAQ
jgi:hypothetical protein